MTRDVIYHCACAFPQYTCKPDDSERDALVTEKTAVGDREMAGELIEEGKRSGRVSEDDLRTEIQEISQN